jgi:hypothetical protein
MAMIELQASRCPKHMFISLLQAFPDMPHRRKKKNKAFDMIAEQKQNSFQPRSSNTQK